MEKLLNSKLVAALAAAVLSAPLATNAYAQGYYGHGQYGGDGWGWGHMIFGPLMLILFIAVAVTVVVLIVRWLGGGGHAPAGGPPVRTALDILRERYARGEIDKEEYEDRCRTLGD